jgi:phosphate transport system permease protein
LARPDATLESPFPNPLAPLRGASRWKKYLPERIIKGILFICSIVSIFTTIGIVSVLVFEGALFFQEVSIIEFLTGTKWTPLFLSKHFGVLPLVAGTMLTAVGAMVVALPLGLLSAIYLSEYAPEVVREVVKPIPKSWQAFQRWFMGTSPCYS